MKMSCTRINSGNSNRETHASYPHSDNLPVEIISHLFEDGLSVGDVISAPVAVTSARFRILDLSALLRRLLVVFSDSRIHLTSEEHIIHGYHFGEKVTTSNPNTKSLIHNGIVNIETQMVYTFFSVDPWILAARPNEYHGALRSGAIVKGGGFEVGRCTNMYKITDSPFVFQIPKFLDVRSPIFHIVHIQMVNLFYANILLATCETHSLTHTRSC